MDDAKEMLSLKHRFILEQRRAELCSCVDVLGSLLLPRLCDKGVLSIEKHDDIQMQSSKEAMVNGIIDHLLQRTNEDFYSFRWALENSEQGHVVQCHLSSKVIEEEIDKLQKALTDYFLDCYSEIELFTWNDEEYGVRLEDVYVPLRWIRYTKEAGEEVKKELTSYHEAFHEIDGKQMKRIVVRGEPFGGKTTFLRKVAHDWSKLTNKSVEINDTNSNLASFKCVLPLILRLTEPDDTLKSVTLGQLDFLEEEHFRTILYLLETQPETVLFVLDGFDEYTPGNCKEITSIIKRNKFPNSCCITTTRPEGIGALSKWRGAKQMEAELHGFGENGIRKFVKEFFKRKSEEVSKAFLDRIFKEKDKDNMLKIAKNPGLLQIMCILWFEKQELSTNREMLFETFIKFLLSKRERRMKEDLDNLTSEDAILDVYEDFLKNLGKLACSREKDLSMKLVFSNKEVIDCLGIEGTGCGFFYKSHPVSKMSSSQVSFFHKLVQEYCAAYYLVNVDQGDARLQLVKRCQSAGVEYEDSLLRFVFYLSQEKSYQIISQVCKYQDQSRVVSSESMHEAFSQLNIGEPTYEDYHAAFVASTFEKYVMLLGDDDWEVSGNFDPISCKLGDYIFVFHFPEYYVMVHNSPGESVSFKNVPFLQLSQQHHFCNLQDLCSVLPVSAAVLVCRKYLPPNLTEFIVNPDKLCIYCTIHDFEFESFFNDLPKLSKSPVIKELVLRNTNNTLTGKGKELGKIVLLLPHLRKLDIWGCKLDSSDMREMGNILTSKQHVINIQELILSSNPLCAGAEGIVLVLQCMKQLVKLDCKSCGLTSASLQQIADYLSDVHDRAKTKLQELDLCGNKFESCGSPLTKIIINLPHLQKLFLSDCSIVSESIEILADNMDTRHSLEQLDLSGNRLDNLSGLGKFITFTPNLKTLWLYFTNSSIGLIELVEKIPSSLTELHLGSNHFANELNELPKHTNSMQNLKWLNLKYSSNSEMYPSVKEKLAIQMPQLELHM